MGTSITGEYLFLGEEAHHLAIEAFIGTAMGCPMTRRCAGSRLVANFRNERTAASRMLRLHTDHAHRLLHHPRGSQPRRELDGGMYHTLSVVVHRPKQLSTRGFLARSGTFCKGLWVRGWMDEKAGIRRARGSERII